MNLKKWFKGNYWLALILLFAVVLRIYHIDYQSLWLDEVLSMNDVNPKLTFKQFYESVLFWEAFPHLYFLLLKYTLFLFGYTSLVARVFSAFIGVFGVYSMYLLGKELLNKNCGLIAASLTCVNVFHIFHSQEVRAYGILFLFTTLSFYRLSIFIKRTTYRNAIFYAFFAGLSINCHFFAFVSLFAQYIILLFFLLKAPLNLKSKIFTRYFIAGIVTLLLIIPTYEAFLHLDEIKSFWVPKPTWDSPLLIFKEFFGNSQSVLFIIYALIIYYLVLLFKDKLPKKSFSNIIENKLIFCTLFLFVWIFVAIILTMVKSYVDLSIMLSRYLIIILPALIVIVAIAIDYVYNKALKKVIVISVLIFSLFDLFIVKDYYNKISKTQLRELATEIKVKNIDNAKIISFYNCVFPFYFEDNKSVNFEWKTLEEHVNSMRNNAVSLAPFWYADINSRPYSLNKDDEAYLNQNFIIKEKLKYFDAWANYYVPKKNTIIQKDDNLVKTFSDVVYDNKGNMMLFNNTTNARSTFFELQKGHYNLIVKGNSLPIKPIKNSNAHIKIKINGIMIGDYFLSENPLKDEKILPFEINTDKQVRIQLIYDNDVFENGLDRNVIIYSIKTEKSKKIN